MNVDMNGLGGRNCKALLSSHRSKNVQYKCAPFTFAVANLQDSIFRINCIQQTGRFDFPQNTKWSK